MHPIGREDLSQSRSVISYNTVCASQHLPLSSPSTLSSIRSCFISLLSFFLSFALSWVDSDARLFTPMTNSAVPSRRRRQSHSGDIVSPLALPSEKLRVLASEAPPRPKSTPAHEMLHQRRRQQLDVADDLSRVQPEKEAMQIDEHENSLDSSSSDSSSSSSSSPSSPVNALAAHTKLTSSTIAPADRPTRPLPTSRARKMGGPTTNNPLPQPANPHMLPVQAHVLRAGPASSQRRCFVILEQACLEAYRVSTGGRSKNGKEGDVKYALLNCDDHQGILAKTGRDIADARPDITHQVCFSSFTRAWVAYFRDSDTSVLSSVCSLCLIAPSTRPAFCKSTYILQKGFS